ncbi:hypothetical protein DN069_21415 [Streptacidiphilus pinicola]|uniref:Uncharacterized protein n=1 Tax=Streptacidiphilus pinicola TaxID=2219663 RepID=A0A2X0IGA4_9ACTN|nr:hypothetical protein DN069_21415 [Streptacidiphilus pinicola]
MDILGLCRDLASIANPHDLPWGDQQQRPKASGYAGGQDPLFFRENSSMVFADAEKSVSDIPRALDADGRRDTALDVRQAVAGWRRRPPPP